MNERFAVVGVLVAGGVSACSGAAGGDRGASPFDAGAELEAGVAEAAPPRDAAAVADASPSDDAGDDRIDPIVVGHAWTYDVTTLGAYPACPSGAHTAAALSQVTMDGKADAIEVQSFCADVGASYYAVRGDVVMVDYQGTWLLALDAPVQEGHTWSNGSSTFTWHSLGTVTVPAGTFDDCWSATQNVAYSAYTIFCRRVGPVRWYVEDLAGDGFDAQLTAKNF